MRQGYLFGDVVRLIKSTGMCLYISSPRYWLSCPKRWVFTLRKARSIYVTQAHIFLYSSDSRCLAAEDLSDATTNIFPFPILEILLVSITLCLKYAQKLEAGELDIAGSRSVTFDMLKNSTLSNASFVTRKMHFDPKISSSMNRSHSYAVTV